MVTGALYCATCYDHESPGKNENFENADKLFRHIAMLHRGMQQCMYCLRPNRYVVLGAEGGAYCVDDADCEWYIKRISQ